MSTANVATSEESVDAATGEDPLDMSALWDSVTGGTFDNLNLDMFFGVVFIVIVRPLAGLRLSLRCYA